MKKTVLSLSLILSSTFCYSQNSDPNPYFRKYNNEDPVNAIKIVNVMESCGFKPVKSTSNFKQFKSVVLTLSDRAYRQLEIDALVLCSDKHEEHFQLYNMYYKPISHSFYDENCKSIIALMLIDGLIKDQ